MASMATVKLPSVPFLNPTGKGGPDASSRCNCDSVVRAPIAPREMRSARDWRDCVEHFGSNWHTAAGEIAEELATDSETLVDLNDSSMSSSTSSSPSSRRSYGVSRGRHA